MGAGVGKMILVDSNIIIYYFSGMEKAREFLNENAQNLAISTITVSEVLSYPMSEDELKYTTDFLKNNFTWFDVSRDIIFKTAEIRRQKKIKTPDAIIGATALIHELTLASRNEKDFKNLPLNFINPFND